MGISYKRLNQQPGIFKRLIGLEIKEFEEILKKVEPLWEKKITLAYKRPERRLKLEVEELIIDTTEQPIERPKRKHRNYL